MSKVLVFGCSGHAKVVVDAIECAAEHEVLGIIGARQEARATWCGHRVLGDESILPNLRRSHADMAAIVAIGDNALRRRVAESAAGLVADLTFITVVHPAAVVARSAVMEPGAFVAAGAVIGAGARVGAHAIVNTNASVDHDCRLGACCSIGPGASLAGAVEIGPEAMVGIGASVLPQIRIGAGAVLGAGGVAVADIPPGRVAVGVPARLR